MGSESIYYILLPYPKFHLISSFLVCRSQHLHKPPVFFKKSIHIRYIQTIQTFSEILRKTTEFHFILEVMRLSLALFRLFVATEIESFASCRRFCRLRTVPLQNCPPKKTCSETNQIHRWYRNQAAESKCLGIFPKGFRGFDLIFAGLPWFKLLERT